MKKQLSHYDEHGNVNMVDVSGKDASLREAVARGKIHVSAEVLDLIRQGEIKKGDPLEVARIAGIMAAKRTHELIPLCHPLLLTQVEVNLELKETCVQIESRVVCQGKTGVEMEALTAVSTAALTIYDMCKAVDKEMVIDNIYLAKKSGGRSGTFVHSKASEL